MSADSWTLRTAHCARAVGVAPQGRPKGTRDRAACMAACTGSAPALTSGVRNERRSICIYLDLRETALVIVQQHSSVVRCPLCLALPPCDILSSANQAYNVGSIPLLQAPLFSLLASPYPAPQGRKRGRILQLPPAGAGTGTEPRCTKWMAPRIRTGTVALCVLIAAGRRSAPRNRLGRPSATSSSQIAGSHGKRRTGAHRHG